MNLIDSQQQKFLGGRSPWVDFVCLENNDALMQETDDPIIPEEYDPENMWDSLILLEGFGSSLSVSARSKYPGVGSVLIQWPSNDDAYIFTDSFEVPEKLTLNSLRTVDLPLDAYMKCFVHVYAENNCYVRIDTQFIFGENSEEVLYGSGNLTFVPANTWTLVVAYLYRSGLTGEKIQFSVVIQDHEQGNIYLSYPVICWDDLPAQNIFARETYLRMPSYIVEADETANQYDFDLTAGTTPYKPLYRFLETASTALGDLWDYRDAIRAIPVDAASEENPAQTSALADPLHAPTAFLPWIAFVTATNLYDPTASLTPWQVIESTYASWAALEAGSPDWDALESLDLELQSTLPFIREQLNRNWYGLRAGSLEVLQEILEFLFFSANGFTIEEAVGQSWDIVARYNNEDWHIGVELTGNPSFGGIGLEDALLPAIPAGYQLTIA